MAKPPQWLEDLANQVADGMSVVDLPSPIGCHFHLNESEYQQWEVTLFCSATELVGGPCDGVVKPPNFTLDLKNVLNNFSEVTSFHWQAFTIGPDDELGSHVSIEGIYEGHYVWLRILAQAPARLTETHRFSRAYQLRVNDTW